MRPKLRSKSTCGMTLVELLMALSIMSVIGLAVFYLLLSSANLNRYIQNQSDGMWESDFTWHRIESNGLAAMPSSAGGMTPTVVTDANGQSRLTFIVPDVTNNTTRTLKYYCTGTSAPFTLVEDDPRYNIGGVPSPIAHNVKSFSVTLDTSTTLKIWCDLNISAASTWIIRRHFCVNCRDF